MTSSSLEDESELRADIVQSAVDMAESLHIDGVDDLVDFLIGYYRQVAVEDLAVADPTDLLGAALSHLRAARDREPSQAVVNVYTPTIDELGWSNGHTVVEVVAEDMPFLVDSLATALSNEDRGIHLVVHPQFDVKRDEPGRLLAVDPADERGGDDVPLDTVAESWIHFDIDRDTDPSSLERLTHDLVAVLRDVRAAVEDWPAMQAVALGSAEVLKDGAIPGMPADQQAEAAQFMNWLADKHFTLLGYREYDLATNHGDLSLAVCPGTGRGILRGGDHKAKGLRSLPEAVQRRAVNPDPLVLTKANSRSTVHRSAYLDYVGVKKFDDDGNVIGEHRFLGLYTAAAYNQSVLQIPVIRAKVATVMHDSGLAAESHLGKDLQQFLETYPRDELFQAEPDELMKVALDVLRLQERRRTRLFLRRDPYGRFMSCLVYLPRDRYTTTIRHKIEHLLRVSLNGDEIDYRASVTESVLARLHFVVRVAKGDELPHPDQEGLLQEVENAVRSWDDDFREAVLETMSEEDATRVLARFADVIPTAYKEAYPARTAVADIRHLDELPRGATEVNLHYPFGADARHRRLKMYRSGSGASLSDILPLLQDMGAEVTDERPFLLVDPGGLQLRLYDIGVVSSETEVPHHESAKERFEDAFMAAWQGRVESDRLNSLVLRAGLNWEETAVLRAFTKYMRQIGSAYSPSYVERVLLSNAGIVRLLIDLFHARFDPERGVSGRDAAQAEIHDEISARLDAIDNLDIDRILRSLLILITACVRTSYYVPSASDEPRQISFKFRPGEIPDLPEPRPLYEIWVYSPAVEGVHLRFGPIARGGIRWSDRPEDFRTEILGLVKAQAVKNSVIVPDGAKGGFFAKQVPETGISREERMVGGRDAYRRFISGLLDLTDNRVSDGVVPPHLVVRHDSDDSYLVVAADKGTATFSDLANTISSDYDFWLGDAFASGGSDGYDHKEMGITARGAWESVRRHFREMGIDTQSEEFSCVGIGDMSGDVFGNGMLLSDQTRLVAAFDHRHIFLDPEPDCEVSIAERRRLFRLPRSSWADYDPELISEGGGVYPRTAKSIPISAQVRNSLGLVDSVESVTPNALIKLILTAQVDLFWNGGIGTYVRATGESDAHVGDKSNDSVRVCGGDLRCKVVGEGGNLGLTQKGRIEAARNGVRLNTDAIDNSAGVDTSDHEVNLKVLLDEVVREGDLTLKHRNKLLRSMTDTVAELVLRHNYAQNTALGNSRAQSASMLDVHVRMMRELVARGALDRQLEDLPDEDEVLERQALGLGLLSPELCVLMAYSKITLADSLGETRFADDDYFAKVLTAYFPRAVTSRFPEAVSAHPLAPQIVATSVVSELVNRGGITFAYRLNEETSAGPLDIVRAFTFAKDVFRLEEYWQKVAALDNTVSTDVQSELYLEARRLVDRTCRWLLHSRSADIDLTTEVERYAPQVDRLDPMLRDMLQGVELERMLDKQADLVQGGVPEGLALEKALMLDRFNWLDIVNIGTRTNTDPAEVAPLYHLVSERFEIDGFLTRISALDREGTWQALARQAMRSDLYQVLASLTAQVVRSCEPGQDAALQLDAWEVENVREIDRVRRTIGTISKLDSQGLAELSVALRSLRTLVAQARS
jgi:glutamate dehydrogenase